MGRSNSSKSKGGGGDCPCCPRPKQYFQVQVPPGLDQGQMLSVAAPNGFQVQVPVPDGFDAGSTFLVEMPHPKLAMIQQHLLGQGRIQEAQRIGFDLVAKPPVQIQPAAAFSVAVPQGANPGETLQVTAPNGVAIQVQIPAGCGSGSTFQVAIPTQPVMQQPVQIQPAAT